MRHFVNIVLSPSPWVVGLHLDWRPRLAYDNRALSLLRPPSQALLFGTAAKDGDESDDDDHHDGEKCGGQVERNGVVPIIVVDDVPGGHFRDLCRICDRRSGSHCREVTLAEWS